MLPPEIVRKINEKFGREIRYSSDVDELVDDIKRTTHESIGLNTVKRLLGMISGKCVPRCYTKYIIARYVGYGSWDELIASLRPESDARCDK